MSAILDRGDLRSGNKIAIAFALAWLGPILISPDQQRWDIDISIVPIVNIELNENMEFARPSSISPPGAQHALRVGRRRFGGL